MILTAHQPVYLPWLGLFHKIALADRFVLLDQVQYQVGDWNNRNKIKTAAGEIWLSVPVIHKNHLELKFGDMKINNAQPWRKKHWKSIYFNYKSAKYFNRYSGFFEDCYEREWDTLLSLNDYMLRWFLGALKIDVPVISASDLDLQGKKGDLILDLCEKLGAETYIFGAQGRNYADKSTFEKAGILPLFQDYKHPIYPQMHGSFVPHMSIIDLLFQCGDDSLEIIMSGNVARAELLTRADWR
jgi:hypothetical protein